MVIETKAHQDKKSNDVIVSVKIELAPPFPAIGYDLKIEETKKCSKEELERYERVIREDLENVWKDALVIDKQDINEE